MRTETISIRLSDRTKTRLDLVARLAGKTRHRLITDLCERLAEKAAAMAADIEAGSADDLGILQP